MAARTLLVVLLFLGSGLAGCFSSNEPTEEGPELTNTSQGPTTEMPDGRGGKIIAFEETNATEQGVGGVDHHHDHWQGRSRVVIFETPEMMTPMAARRAAEYKALATFRPPDGALVYEGTDTVEFTVSNPERHVCGGEFTLGGEYVCTDSRAPGRVPDPTGGPSGLKLRYKHSGTTTWIDVGDLAWGVALPIKIKDARETDMPHATSSLWEFQVVSNSHVDGTLRFTAKAELVRGEGDIPLWPGHPDFYKEKPSREVLNAEAVAGDAGLYGHGSVIVPANAGPVFAQRLISYGTKTLYVWINVTDFQAPNPATAPSNLFLFHTNATGRENITDPFDHYTVDQRELFWILPVDDGSMDSPYADGSRWHFELGASMTAGISCYAGCANWAAKYTIVVHASSIEEPAENYHLYCLRDQDCPA